MSKLPVFTRMPLGEVSDQRVIVVDDQYISPMTISCHYVLRAIMTDAKEALSLSKKLLAALPSERVAEPDFVRLASLLVRLEVE